MLDVHHTKLQTWPLAEAGLFVPPFVRHSSWDKYVDVIREDAVQNGLIQGSDIRRFERFIVLDALVYPYTSFDLLVVTGGFNQCLFFLDDQYDDDPAVGKVPARVREIVGQAFDALAHRRLPSNPTPFHRLCARVGAQIRSHSSDALWDRFVGHLHDYLYEGVLVATSSWGTVLPPEEYRAVRLLDSGTWCVPDLVEVATQCELEPETVADPVVAELRRLVCEHATFVNDLASYHREVVRAGGTFNLVLSIATHETGGDIQAAISKVVAELNAGMCRFEELAAQTTGKAALHAHALRYWISGNHRFSFHSGRYHHPEAHLPELRGTPTDTPAPLDERRIARPVKPVRA
jgi:hypothetical protein